MELSFNSFKFIILISFFILKTQSAEEINNERSNLADCPLNKRIKYRAAVLEYEAFNDWNNVTNGSEILMINVENILEFAGIAMNISVSALNRSLYII